MPPDVSIIIATHNVEAYIARAISSALAQVQVNVEVIVVDDASTDNTCRIVQQFNDPRVKLITLPQNKGPGGARNAGFAAATAPWIAVLDGDDDMAPERLARCLALAQKTNAQIIVDNLSVRREADGATFPMFPAAQFNAMDTIDLAAFIKGNRSFLGGYTLGYLKPIFSAVFLRQHNLTYSEILRIGEDYIFMVEALARGAACVIEKHAGYNYTVRADSISHRLSEQDVLRIQAGDKALLRRYIFPQAAAAAQKQREKRLKESLAFTQLVDAIKGKDVAACCRIALRCPSSLKYLWYPVEVRLTRIRKKVLGAA